MNIEKCCANCVQASKVDWCPDCDGYKEYEGFIMNKDIEALQSKLQKAIAAIEQHKVNTMCFRMPDDFSDAEDKLWKTLEELR